MRKIMNLSMAAVVLGLVIGGCSEDEETNPTGVSNELGGEVTNAPGVWSTTLGPIGTMIPDPLSITFDIVADSSYTMRVEEQGDTETADTLFHQYGVWTVMGEDSLRLTGTECMIIDTSADPDTLKTVGQDICSMPLTLPAPAETVWVIKPAALGPALSAFPIPPEFIEVIQDVPLHLAKEN
jgi:hypothetical protein